jgi:hypothetical protein
MHDIDPLSTAAAERLRALPEERTEPYGWEEFRRRAAGAARGPARRAPTAALALRAAAAILLIAGASAFAAWMWGRSMPPANQSIAAGPSSSTMAAAGPRGTRSDPVDARTRAMEVWLARQPAEPAMVRVGAYATEAGLEDRIAQLDDLLTNARAEGVESASLSPLEEQRARLVSSLVQVRFAETLVSESPR